MVLPQFAPSRRFLLDKQAHLIKPSGRLIVPCAQAASRRRAPHLRHESQVPPLRCIIGISLQPKSFLQKENVVPSANDNLYTNCQSLQVQSSISNQKSAIFNISSSHSFRKYYARWRHQAAQRHVAGVCLRRSDFYSAIRELFLSCSSKYFFL
jgi:hypothetical protein